MPPAVRRLAALRQQERLRHTFRAARRNASLTQARAGRLAWVSSRYVSLLETSEGVSLEEPALLRVAALYGLDAGTVADLAGWTSAATPHRDGCRERLLTQELVEARGRIRELEEKLARVRVSFRALVEVQERPTLTRPAVATTAEPSYGC